MLKLHKEPKEGSKSKSDYRGRKQKVIDNRHRTLKGVFTELETNCSFESICKDFNAIFEYYSVLASIVGIHLLTHMFEH